MPSIDAFILGFFVGMLCTGTYIQYMMRYLKKKGYILFEPTQKLKDELSKKENDIKTPNKMV